MLLGALHTTTSLSRSQLSGLTRTLLNQSIILSHLSLDRLPQLSLKRNSYKQLNYILTIITEAHKLYIYMIISVRKRFQYLNNLREERVNER